MLRIQEFMLSAIFVGAASILLLGYWFRYTALLILSTKTSQDFSYDIAHAHELQFHEVRASLAEVPMSRFATLQSGLDHDYRLVSALLRNVETSESGACLEDVILRIDFIGLKLAYRLSLPFSENAARRALTEMADVVAHFANAVGERSMATNSNAA
jgi:hypothetical protein